MTSKPHLTTFVAHDVSLDERPAGAGPVARLEATLARHSLSSLLEPLADAMAAYVETHARELTTLLEPEPLTPGERAALAAVSGADPEGPPDLAPLVSTAMKHAALLQGALPLKEAAGRLGVNDSRLRQRIQEGTLFAMRLEDGRTWVLPAFQFTERGELPGLRIAMKGVRRDAHPVAVANFFQSPQPDLEAEDGSAMTPVQWLAEGRDPELVQDLATGI